MTEVTELNPAQECTRLREENARLRQENIGLRQEAHHYRELHRRALGRIQKLEAENQALKEKNGELNRRLFGRKSEKFTAQQAAGKQNLEDDSCRPQVGKPGELTVDRLGRHVGWSTGKVLRMDRGSKCARYAEIGDTRGITLKQDVGGF